ncbi:YybH family protein [Marinivivus vitaminiproducens]|uniref:YybH family protein n=1 Tax=Marinivivus vitaminiproducens TaxID=3035935 RepID=UPI00279BEB5C|nr:SgcJ/EcaC family oxidoreductase [Geminicoccaceae bacterium SCSIO 64248]
MDIEPVDTDVRALIDAWLDAVRVRDVPRIMACYAPDVRAFDAVGKLQFRGRDAYGEHWQACMTMCNGTMIFEIDELEIAADASLALVHYVCRCGAVMEDGEEKSGWMRATVACSKASGRWLITHDHFSAPFDPETCNALFDRNA